MTPTSIYWRWLFPLINRAAKAWFADPETHRRLAHQASLKANLALILCGATLGSWPLLSPNAWAAVVAMGLVIEALSWRARHLGSGVGLGLSAVGLLALAVLQWLPAAPAPNDTISLLALVVGTLGTLGQVHLFSAHGMVSAKQREIRLKPLSEGHGATLALPGRNDPAWTPWELAWFCLAANPLHLARHRSQRLEKLPENQPVERKRRL